MGLYAGTGFWIAADPKPLAWPHLHDGGGNEDRLLARRECGDRIRLFLVAQPAVQQARLVLAENAVLLVQITRSSAWTRHECGNMGTLRALQNRKRPACRGGHWGTTVTHRQPCTVPAALNFGRSSTSKFKGAETLSPKRGTHQQPLILHPRRFGL